MGGGPTVDFWFDFSSPFAYLACTQIEAIAARTGAQVRWRPMLLGAVFRAVGQVDVPLLGMGAAKQTYYAMELDRWAARWGVPFTFNPTFPLRTVTPLRAFLAHPDPLPFARRVFHAAWAESRDVGDPCVLSECGAPDDVLSRVAEQRQALIDSTQAAIDAGVFGAPAFVVNGRWLFWGQDRLGMVERALLGWIPPA